MAEATSSDSVVTTRPGVRPLPLRTSTYSECEAGPTFPIARDGSSHLRRKSAQTTSEKSPTSQIQSGKQTTAKVQVTSLDPVPESFDNSTLRRVSHGGLPTPPSTPQKATAELLQPASSPTPYIDRHNCQLFDFTKIDYELDRARAIGKGLWSVVYFAQPIVSSTQQARRTIPSPPTSPQSRPILPPCGLFAVKTASRRDAKVVYLQEARTLTLLQQSPVAHHFIVPFLGLDDRSDSLVFEGIVGGSLESLCRRLNVMTELERHLQLRSVFPKLASDLVSGLAFIHDAGVCHADIKPGNVLLDISDHEQGSYAIRARYIDFSASFVPGQDSAANAGGTWEYMAPEQISIQKDLSTPTFASDAWSLGINLLYLIVGASPYTAACGDNMFRLREAIKSGDPLRFARMDPVVQKRLAACQDFVDCCRLVLQKDRTRRLTAAAWRDWINAEGWR